MSRLIAFWSPTGAGATTLLLNTAAALGARRVRLAALDFNLTTPSLALHADLLPHDAPQRACLSHLLPALEGERLTAEELGRALLPAHGFFMLPGMLDLAAASRLTAGQIRQIVRTLSARCDLILADLTPSIDSVGCRPLLEMADQVLVVVGPEIASRFHTRRALLELERTALPSRLGLLYNRAAGISAQQVGLDIGLPVMAVLPPLMGMESLTEAGRIAALSSAPMPGLQRFRAALEQVATQVMRG